MPDPIKNMFKSGKAMNNGFAREEKLKEAFSRIKEEMGDHLEAINENTNELNSTNEYVAQLEEMINKLSERLDDAELKIAELSGKKAVDADSLKNIVLTAKEEEIFLLLYSRTGDLMDYREISKITGLTEELAIKNVASMTAKGIPVVKKYFEDKMLLILDPDFRNLQAKENIIKLKGKK